MVARPVAPAAPPRPRLRPARADLAAVALLGLGYVALLTLFPPTRDFAYLDDWTFVRSVEGILAGRGFLPSEPSQMTLVFHAYWGALFGAALGYSFTALTLANLTMSFLGALALYVLLRRVGFGAGLSGLGAALLALNPYYLLLSYSFMTEITFVALLLIACVAYLEGLRGGATGWLWVGGACAAGACLTRQFGLALPLAAALWLLAARRLSPGRLVAVALLPALALGGYYLWSRGFPPTLSDSISRAETLDLLRGPGPWATRAAHFVYLALFLPGLTIPLYGRVRRPWLVALAAGAAAGAVFLLWRVKLGLVQQGRSALDDLSLHWLQPAFANPVPVYCLGAALTVWLLARIGQRAARPALALLRRRRAPAPADFLYCVALILFVGTYIVSAGFLDRYWLPIVPFLIAGGLVGLRGAGRRSIALRLAALLALAGYGLAAHVDDYNALRAEWAAGRWVIAQGVAADHLSNGTPWNGYYLFDEALRRLGSHDIGVIGRAFPPDQIITPDYVIDTTPSPGYRVVARFPYFSPLARAEQVWLVQRR